jgi:hypothetical protein
MHMLAKADERAHYVTRRLGDVDRLNENAFHRARCKTSMVV